MRFLWQVQGLNTEYERLRKESEGKGPGKGASGAASEGPTSLQGLRKEVQSLQVSVTGHMRWPECSTSQWLCHACRALQQCPKGSNAT